MEDPTQKQLSPDILIVSTSHSKLLIIIIICTVASLILILFALNYFRIISFDKIFNRTSKTPTPITVKIPSKVQTDMQNFVKTFFKSSFIPISLETQQKTPKQKAQNQGLNQFYTYWQIGGISYSASLAYNNQFLPEDNSILITLPQLTALTTSSAATLVEQYLNVHPQSTWECKEAKQDINDTKKATLCENFWVDEQKIKHGVGVMSPFSADFQKTSIFTCNFYPISPSYPRKSCSIYNN